MNVAIDSGNTYSKVGWFEKDRLVDHQAGLEFDQMIEQVKARPAERIIYSSVSRSLEEFRQKMQPQVPVLHLTSETKVPVGINYETPGTLGMDRLAAAVGGNFLFPAENVVIIDAGSCITYDLIDKEGVFQGGIIAPGMRMRLKAMHVFTKRLPLLEEIKKGPLIGKNTAAAMESGVTNGMLAEVKGIIEAYRHIFHEVRVLICGGDSGFFESHLKLPIFAVPELVLIGLNRILQYNVPEIQ